MKTWKLLLLALVPGLWGWLCNWLTALSLNGPAFLFTLAFYIQVPAAIVFCLWLGHLCGRSERSYPACLLLTQWQTKQQALTAAALAAFAVFTTAYGHDQWFLFAVCIQL